MSEYEDTASATFRITRGTLDKEGPGLRGSMHDIDWFGILPLVVVIIVFVSLPLVIILSYAIFSGGMRWLLVLSSVTTLGLLSLYLMKRGVERQTVEGKAESPRTEYTGDLTGLTETAERASYGYAYSQGIIKQRIAGILIHKMADLHDMSQEDITKMLEKDNAGFVEDERLKEFLLNNWHGAENPEVTGSRQRKHSKERGERFMIEVNEVLDTMDVVL